MNETGETHPPSLFDSIKAHSNCLCAYCWMIWSLVETETIQDFQWVEYGVHLTECHGWTEGEGEQ